MMDNRLDYINEFQNKDAAIEEMAAMRVYYIHLDAALQSLDSNNNPAMARTVSLARTNLETSLQYAIKSLCLKHEKKS